MASDRALTLRKTERGYDVISHQMCEGPLRDGDISQHQEVFTNSLEVALGVFLFHAAREPFSAVRFEGFQTLGVPEDLILLFKRLETATA